MNGASAAVRTRFAPSPTGALHLGNARTAILNWLFARRMKGAFVLRIEDTDFERAVDGGEEMIYEALAWLGMVPDEGPREGGPLGPYRQSERDAAYAERAGRLLETGRAFKCFCSPEEVEARRAAAIGAGEAAGRDRRCRGISDAAARRRETAGERAAVRLLVESGPVTFRDRLKGAVTIDGDDLGDIVLLRSDGRPTYNFAATMDDIAMKISHVIRGIGHLSNTAKQALLYRAFGVAPPEFVHIPTILAPVGGKLSKRRGAKPLLAYRDRGFHPEAVVNYLSLLSWSAEDGEEFMTRDELVERIDLDRLGAADAQVDERKMTWLSGRHLRHEPAEDLARRWAERVGSVPDVGAADLIRAAEVFAERTRLLSEVASEVAPLFRDPCLRAPEIREALSPPSAAVAIGAVMVAWDESEWRPGPLARSLRNARRRAGLAGRAFFAPVRAALTGRHDGPKLGDIAYALGRERTLRRLASAIK